MELFVTSEKLIPLHLLLFGWATDAALPQTSANIREPSNDLGRNTLEELLAFLLNSRVSVTKNWRSEDDRPCGEGWEVSDL